MICNLPGEDEGDIYRIVKLAKDLADIREAMNQPTVQIQFSWTPLIVEANTPFQWFAPTSSTRTLSEVFEGLRDFNISFKIGSKAQPDKLAFFQLCQRASRDVGEALVDAMEATGQATWGGFPQRFRDLIEDKLRAHGFGNGYADCFDEREKRDMFGWEFISQGISTELLWVAYQQMREFVEQTDSATYDEQFDAEYHGNEWIERCDTRCYGKTCGTCTHDDLKIRRRYLQAARNDADIDLSTLQVIDQRTQAMRVRVRVHKPEQYRHVGNDHWRFAIRRAAFRAQHTLGLPYGIAKRTIRFASDEVKHRAWTAGVDYVEFALTRQVGDTELTALLGAMNTELAQWLRLGDWVRHPAKSTTMRADVDLNLYQLEIDAEPVTVLNALDAWHTATHIPMRLKIDAGYFAPAAEDVNAKDFVDDLWLTNDGHRLLLRMLVRGRPTPYNIYAALMRRPSWLDAAKLPAVRLDAFVETDRAQHDFFRPSCQQCGLQIPVNLLDQPYDDERCPRCKDHHDGRVITHSST
jgi:hypothetical protein